MAKPPRKPVLKKKQTLQAPAVQTPAQREKAMFDLLGKMALTEKKYTDLSKSPFVRDTLGWDKPLVSDIGSGGMASYSPEEDRISVNLAAEPDLDVASAMPLASRRTTRANVTHEVGHAHDFRARKENRVAFPEYARVNRPRFSVAMPKDFRYTPDQALPPLSMWQNPKLRVLGIETNKPHAVYNTQNNTVKRVPSKGIRKVLGIQTEQPMTPSERQALANLDRYYALGRKAIHPLTGEKFLNTDPDESLAQAYTNAVDFLSKTGADTAGYREMLGRYEGNTPGAGAIVQDLLRSRSVYGKHPLKGVIR